MSDPITPNGNEEEDKTTKPVRCRVGLHHFEEHKTEEGKTYRSCSICGEEEYHRPVNFGADGHHR
jgi:hypothetical protein